MKILNVEIPSGYEVDLEQSILKENDVKIVIKEAKKPLPKTWEELGIFVYGHPNDELDKAEVAMRKLSQLREVYRQGWKPDWNDNEDKYLICFYRDTINSTISSYRSFFLSFQSAEIRDEFLKNFASLIEAAKPLLS